MTQISSAAPQDTIKAGDPRQNATVSASAGTGKTWLLVTRIIRLLLDGARPDGILAITFTRKAAAEMQTRLRERLLILAEADALALDNELRSMGVAATAEHQHSARGLYEILLRAPRPPRTTTFHAFCQDVLRRFPLEADVAPGFELLEATRALEREALDALYSEATLAPHSPPALALEILYDRIGGISTDGALLNFLAHRSEWWAYTADAEDPVAFAANATQRLLDVDPEFDSQAHCLISSRNDIEEFALLLQKHGTDTNREHAARLINALQGDGDLAQRFARVKRAFLTLDNQPLKRKSSKAQIKSLGESGEARFLQLHEQLASRLIEALDVLRAQQTLQQTRAWQRAGQQLIEHYQRIKDERRQLDFNDLEWKTYTLLNRTDNAQWVQYKLDQRIDHVLIDEFQDTNPIQWRLLLPLIEELAASGGERARSVFLVGDAKQSIYRFRRADARVFSAAQLWLQTHLHAENFTLDVSRRSAQAVIDCVNTVFEADNVRDVWLEFPHHTTHHQNLRGHVEVLPLIDSDTDTTAATATALRNPLLQPRSVAEDQRYAHEGAQIAQRIVQLITARTLIGEAPNARLLDYGDILILVRNRTHVGAYESALRAAGIPYAGADRGTLLDSLEVRDLVALLDSLVTPFDNLALAAVLRSPVFDCSDTDLMLLARSGTGRWIQRLATLAPQLPETHPLHRAQRYLQTWRTAAERLPTHDLLDRIYHEGNLVERYQAAFAPHLHTRLRANLTRFIELALELDSGRYPSLANFLQRLREARRGSDDAPDAGETGATRECVQLLTIHAAKGLEAPVVFIADATNPPRQRRGVQALVNWPPAAAQPECFMLTGKKDDLDAYSRRALARDELAEQREELNLLYVAMTRARQMLFISGSTPKRGQELGWYGTVCASLQARLGESAVLVLESGTPATQTAQSAVTPRALTTVDPRLSKVFDLDSMRTEISPSRNTAILPWQNGADDAELRGQVIHRMLDLLARSPSSKVSSIRQRVAAEFRCNHNESTYNEWCDEAMRVVHAPDFQWLFDSNKYRAAYNEVAITYEHDNKTVYGIIDRAVIVDNHHMVLIDYKTHRSARPENIQEFAAVYREQMQRYAQGLRQIWPTHTVRSVLLFTRCCATIEIATD
ncbi:MAG: UvrD-helicase domain-containing protein [Gammaproteobacteria bacterium]|nr:UvrD-helicase domain-containing protein [Gammaproteobacteria bacterium]